MKNRKIEIIKLTLEEYMRENGSMYEEGNLWDYPLCELEYIIKETEINKLALIDDRLYELA